MTLFRVARLAICPADRCAFSDHQHLTVALEYVELESSRAIAISYTWGEYERELVNIGHHLDQNDHAVQMELGKEWELHDWISTLATICTTNGKEHGPEHAFVWIDQLCNPKDQVRKTLAQIPTIYRTLHVVVLMPGGQCECLTSAIKSATDINSLLPDDYCLNALGSCSYFGRQWTRQELMYSRTVQMVRCSSGENLCVRSHSDADHLSSYNRQLFEQLLSRGEQRSQAFKDVREDQAKFLVGMLSVMEENNMDLESFRTFFCGERLEKPSADGGGLLSFLNNLTYLSHNPRRATKPRDYVLSVWTDCPGYQVPDDYDKMDDVSLLENAIGQLERNHGITVKTTAVAGLFEHRSSGSATWRPTKYLREYLLHSTISTSADLYRGVHYSGALMPIQPNGEMILAKGQALQSLGQRARKYSDVFKEGVFVPKELQAVASNWPTVTRQNILVQEEHLNARESRLSPKTPGTDWMTSTPVTLEMQTRRYTHWLIHYLFQKTYHGEKNIPGENPWGKGFSQPFEAVMASVFHTVNHYEIIYKLVAAALRLDHKLCKNFGLDLMVVLEEYPCIGFTTVDPGPAQDMITISTGLPNSGRDLDLNGDLFYEAIKEEGPGDSKYRVCGVWVPFGRTSQFLAGKSILDGDLVRRINHKRRLLRAGAPTVVTTVR